MRRREVLDTTGTILLIAVLLLLGYFLVASMEMSDDEPRSPGNRNDIW